MKTTIKGAEAYLKIIGTALPKKIDKNTKTHSSVIGLVRTEIVKAGLTITGEEYRCSNNGHVATGTFLTSLVSHPDLTFAVSFINSYNKQYSFQIGLGYVMKDSENFLMGADGVSKNSVILAFTTEDYISSFIRASSGHLTQLVSNMHVMKRQILSEGSQFEIIGEMFFKKNMLSSMQMNMIKTIRDTYVFSTESEYEYDPNSAWALYNYIGAALKETHPGDWIDAQVALHRVFNTYVDFSLTATAEPVSDHESLLKEAAEPLPF